MIWKAKFEFRTLGLLRASGWTRQHRGSWPCSVAQQPLDPPGDMVYSQEGQPRNAAPAIWAEIQGMVYEGGRRRL